MPTTLPAEKPKLELSCREANLIIRLTPLEKNFEKMCEEEVAAIKHYLGCGGCRDRGLADILERQLTCREAVLVWAKHAQALWQSCNPAIFFTSKTLLETYAVEHVWGKFQWRNSRGGCDWDPTTACHENPCRSLQYYWASIPMSSSAGDGPEGVINLFHTLAEIFLKEKWPLNKLLTIQKNRITMLIRDIQNNKVTVSTGHYHSVDELIAEINVHVAVLQKLTLR